MERVETVVVGGGQAGLAVGYHLARHRRPFVILDAGDRVGDSWRDRWDTLRVFTPARYSGLPGWPYPGPGWSYPTKDDMGGYLEAYATRFALPVRTGSLVDGISRANGEFVVSTGTTGYRADNVVVATGAYQVPRVPAFAAALDPAIVQLHSSAYRNPAQLRGPILVVGAGNSGAEIAVEAAAVGPTVLSGRDTGQEPVRAGSPVDRMFVPAFWFLLSRVLTTGSPLGRAARRHLTGRGLPLARVRRSDLKAAGVERVPRVTGVRDGRPELADGRVLDVATVVWCTGFGSDFRWIDLPVLDAHGEPEHTRGIVPAQSGLYFVGLFFLASAASPLIGGVGRDAGHVVRHIVARRIDATTAD